MKLDVEGHESAVLAGATRLLRSHPVAFILAEYLPGAYGTWGGWLVSARAGGTCGWLVGGRVGGRADGRATSWAVVGRGRR